MARAIQLEKLPIIQELPEAEEVEETEVAAVSADIEPRTVTQDLAFFDEQTRSSRENLALDNYIMVSAVTYDQFSHDSVEEKKEPEKTFLPLPQGKRIIILD